MSYYVNHDYKHQYRKQTNFLQVEFLIYIVDQINIAIFNSIDCIEPIMKSLNWTTGNRNGVELYKETCEMISPIGACIMKGHIEMT